MLVHKFRTSITASSGDGSANTLKFSGAQLAQIYAKATTSTTIFDLTFTDEDGDVIHEILAIEGEHEINSIDMPMRGIYTIGINDSTRDEAIIVKLMLYEN